MPEEDDDFSVWIELNTDKIIDRYCMRVQLEDIPDEFIQDMYQEYLNTKNYEPENDDD